jgi:hypothetical protein
LNAREPPLGMDKFFQFSFLIILAT